MSDPKHKEDISGIVITALIPTIMIAVWIAVSVMGLDGSRELLETLRAEAHEALRPLGPSACRLRELADFVVGRSS